MKSKKTRVYIINHHLWPDGSPSAIYSEQLADNLGKKNIKTVLVGTNSFYRKSDRRKPKTESIVIQTNKLNRNSSLSLIIDHFLSFIKLFLFCKNNISKNDLCIISSSPIFNIFLIFALPKKSARIFWMLDYLPASIMCYGRFMLPVKFILEILWNLLLRQYSVVIKPAANFGFHGNNSVIYRFWPTINFNQKEKLIKPNKTVTYLGNLGFVYNYDAVIQKAREYKNRGYEINFYADGPNVNKLPTWIKKKQFHSEKELKNILIENEIFLVAGTIHTDECSFPSKVWNSLSLGREIVPCGFSKNMLNELELVKRSINQDNLEALSIYIKNIAFTNKNLT